MINEFSNVLLKEYMINKNKHIDNEYAISFQQLSETQNLYLNQDIAKSKESAFKLKENDVINIINSLYTSEDWLDPDEYVDHYTK